MPSITNTHLSVLWKKRAEALLEVGKNCSALVINASALASRPVQSLRSGFGRQYFAECGLLLPARDRWLLTFARRVYGRLDDGRLMDIARTIWKNRFCLHAHH